MSGPSAIEVAAVSKVFKLHTEKVQSLKERVIHPLRTSSHSEFWALRDISLDVGAGETFGLVGHNGSGKSTLLKIVAGILQPTTGEVRTRGRLAALLELGAGFHPELTGRENVYNNALILGMKKSEIDRLFDEIVAFAELEEFIDNQVKFYSSGMYVRLGFAVAVSVDPEILLVDEVLAVGDERFQAKCLDRVRTFQREGRTIVVVTHAADLVRQLCDRAAALHRGELVSYGDPGTVIRVFREHLMSGVRSIEDLGEARDAGVTEFSPLWGRVKIAAVKVHHDSQDRMYVLPGEPLQVEVTLRSTERVDDVVAAIAVYDSDARMLYSTNTHNLGIDVFAVEGDATVEFSFDELTLLDGAYAVSVGLHSLGGLVYDQRDDAATIEVASTGREVGLVRLPCRARVHAAGEPAAANG